MALRRANIKPPLEVVVDNLIYFERRMHVKTYIHINKKNGEILSRNRRGFYCKEKEKLIKEYGFKESDFLCVENEVEKYHLKDFMKKSFGLKDEMYNFWLWNSAYNENNINGFSLPCKVETNAEYRAELEKILMQYIECLNKPPFIYSGILNDIEQECSWLIKALDYLIEGENEKAENLIERVVDLLDIDSFFVSELDKSYSFRAIAPFATLQNVEYNKVYKKMMEENLTFFRVRTKQSSSLNNITNVEQMLHLPYNLREKAVSSRFSSAETPSLYLGTSSYICSKECKWNGIDEMYVSVFVPNSRGKKFKILNLTISQALINGIYNRNLKDDNNQIRYKLQNDMLKIYSLVIATSFSVEKQEETKFEYLLSQTLMKVVSKRGIDGIAYLSMKGENEFQYPQGVNLVIPATDISSDKPYSEKCDGFNVSEPVLYLKQKCNKKKSYVNEIFGPHDDIIGSVTPKMVIDGEQKPYSTTEFGEFDNYLVSHFFCQ